MATRPVVGDTVVYTGKLGQYNGTPQMKNGVVEFEVKHNHSYSEGKCVCGAEDPNYVAPEQPDTPDQPGDSTLKSETISFASTTNRVSQSGDQQIWGLGDVTITNNKASSTNAIIDSSNPVRFYKGSELVFKAPGNIKTIVIETSGSNYANVPTTLEGATVVKDGTIFTITLTNNTNEYKISLTAGQVRASSITISYSSDGTESVQSWLRIKQSLDLT